MRGSLRRWLHHFRSNREVIPACLVDEPWLKQQAEAASLDIKPTGRGWITQLSAHPDLSPTPLFDPHYYLRNNPDVASSGVNPFLHFLKIGGGEGRSPSVYFDTGYYRRQLGFRPLARNPLVDFLIDGWRGGLRPNPFFLTEWYRLQSGLADAEAPVLLAHYAKSGDASLMSPSPLFDSVWYMSVNTDLDGRAKPFAHFIEFGERELRAPNPLFSPSYYLGHFKGSDIRPAHPVAHYLEAGEAAGHAPHPLFSPDFYLRTNQDVAASGINGLTHFLMHGGREGRSPHPLFDAAHYRTMYPEAQGSSPLLHYLDRPPAERRHTHILFDGFYGRAPSFMQDGADPDPLTDCILNRYSPETQAWRWSTAPVNVQAAANAEVMKTESTEAGTAEGMTLQAIPNTAARKASYPEIDVFLRADRPAHRVTECLEMLKAFSFNEVFLITTDLRAAATPIGGKQALFGRTAGGALAAALQRSSAPYFVVIDPLAISGAKSWIDALWDYMEPQGVSFVGGLLLDARGSILSSGLSLNMAGLVVTGKTRRAPGSRVWALPAAAILGRRDAVDAIGGPDEDFDDYDFVFADLMLRTIKSGRHCINSTFEFVRDSDVFSSGSAVSKIDEYLFMERHPDINTIILQEFKKNEGVSASEDEKCA